MNTDKKLLDSISSGVNAIIARFLIAVFAAIAVVFLLTVTGVFLTTIPQMTILLLVSMPSAVYGFLVLHSRRVRGGSRTKLILCTFMCLQTFAVAMAGYSYLGNIILLMPVLLSALYPRSKVNAIVSGVMILCGLVIPPLALVMGFWDGDYYEFLYDLSFARQMDTATLSDAVLTRGEQVISALRFCSTQNVLTVGGFSVIGRLIYRQTNRSFLSQKDVIRLSETDELTGLYNRNSFERRLGGMDTVKKSLTCFYFDVNGLHEMNNTKGHKAGDAMLQFVGKEIQSAFGEENAYRVGGDEYVAMSSDLEAASLPAVKDALEKAFAAQDYHVAIGCAQGKDGDRVDALVQQAEKEMYAAKSEYYIRHDRRTR